MTDDPVAPGHGCRRHLWNAYTTALQKAAAAAKAESLATEGAPTPEQIEEKPRRAKGKASTPVAESQVAVAE